MRIEKDNGTMKTKAFMPERRGCVLFSENMDTITTIFFYGFIVFVALTLLYVLFSDFFDGIFDSAENLFINPTLIFSFGAVFFGSGLLFELKTEFAPWLVILISLVIATLLVSLLHVFIFAPIKKAEQSTAYSLQDYVGKIGTLTVPIPKDGLGQISINDVMGYQSYPAKTKDGSPLEDGTEVRIVRVEDGVFFVKVYVGSMSKKEK